MLPVWVASFIFRFFACINRKLSYFVGSANLAHRDDRLVRCPRHICLKSEAQPLLPPTNALNLRRNMANLRKNFRRHGKVDQ
jgi:hypothetical protein